MARFLQTLLSANEPMFSVGLAKLEETTGHSGVDTRLIADITYKAYEVMRKLGLDTRDSTGQEVFLALIAAVRREAAESLLTDTDYVMLPIDNQVVSFNLFDVIENSHFGLSFENQSLSHGQLSLRSEIIRRYTDHPRTDDTVTHDIASSAGILGEVAKVKNYENVNTARNQSQNAPYILSIGDIVSDAFIKLLDSEAEVYTDDKGHKRLSMEFGSKPPYDYVDIVQAVGNSANAAVAFSRLGLRAGLRAFLGDDSAGKDSIKYLTEQNVETDLVKVQSGIKSNYHYVLRYGADRTILIKYEDYDYTWQAPSSVPDWIYLSMISESAWGLHEDMLAYLGEHPETKLVFQPGTFHFEWGAEKLAGVYGRSYLVVMNREEAALVTGASKDSVRGLAEALHNLGPEIVIITDGPAGAYSYQDGRLMVMPNYPDPKDPYDRTGAGDAFASTLVAALAMGETLETAMKWAPINSMSVVQKIGAQAGLLTKYEIEEYLSQAPDGYYPKEFNE